MDFVSIVLSSAGLVISLIALRRARTAYQMAATVIGRKNVQEDSQRLHDLISKLKSIKGAALRNSAHAGPHQSAGRSKRQDLDGLSELQDALRTELPISWSDSQRSVALNAADELQTALANINDPHANRDGWKDALSALQTLLPWLEQEERKLRDVVLLPVGS